MKVTIKTYDVWGNAEDGFEVNDVRSYTVEFDGTCDDLINDTVGFLNEYHFAKHVPATRLNIVVENNDDQWLDIEVEAAEDNWPVCGITVEK